MEDHCGTTSPSSHDKQIVDAYKADKPASGEANPLSFQKVTALATPGSDTREEEDEKVLVVGDNNPRKGFDGYEYSWFDCFALACEVR